MDRARVVKINEMKESKPPLPSTECGTSQPSLGNNPQAQQAMAETLGMLFRSLRHYGKTGEDLTAMISLFKAVLQDEDPQKIQKAFVKWAKTSPDMPTPSDIMSLIHPQDPWDKIR